MEYIALRRFKTYGVQYHRNDKMTEDKLRNPILYLQEGKIAKIVSSSISPEQSNADPAQGTEVSDAVATQVIETNNAVSSSNTAAPVVPIQVATPVQVKEDTNKPVKITINK